ncbi:3092_t:CDS:2 [Funneliformis mosseae]|uniref:3092_t:CDS:1 n=1 Tax=Funneliformis mosseae TaxID=27381 RepID=A0A9N9FUG6_FUNMO|nr:3092_t:CDS:2 [Funneliformis mosseae]
MSLKHRHRSCHRNCHRIVSDFTKEQHVTFFYDIQENRNLHFNEKVVDDIYGCTNGYTGLEGLFASLCIEYASNGKTLDFSTWNNCFIEFISAKNLLGCFLIRGTLSSSEIDNEEDSISIVHLRTIGNIKSRDNYYEFTSNIILDILTSTANQHTFSESVIQGELYTLLRIAASYTTYKVFRETRTLKKSEKKCDIWVCNNYEYGIECKVNKVSDNDIMSAANQAIGKHHEYQFTFPNVVKPRDEIYFEMVHILYSQATRSAKVLHNCMVEEISFASN